VLRIPLRTLVRRPLPDIASPAFDLDTLRQDGICPAVP
jgi:hypothetical protein